MKYIVNALLIVLALNFLVVAGGIGWLFYNKQLDRERIGQIREIVFPPPVEEPKEENANAPTTQPVPPLEQLLARVTGYGSTNEKLEQSQQLFDAQAAELERKRQELTAQLTTINQAREQLTADRENLKKQQQTLEAERQETERLANDKGFQDSLALYQSMPSKQAKQVFMGLDDETVIRYLQAMPPRTAARIVKEFKSPAEISRIQHLMEMMRQAEPAPTPAPEATASTEGL
ncbi:MAG: hypothetical protein IT448_06855 [Phycisphaerales bacterium]|nr:hypothetical protein [Phycisphaerales bacterium]